MQVAISGSGKIGATLARRLAETGYGVTLANTRGAGSLAPPVAEPGSLASAAEDVAGIAAAADVIVLAMPFFVFDRLPPAAFDGKIVIDATNPNAGRDGDIPALQDDSTPRAS